jgi:hypothetical protein
MSNVKAAACKIRIVATIGDIVFRDVVSVSGTFDLSGIPTCSIIVAVGRNGDDKPATIHKALDQLVPRMKASIVMQVVGRGTLNLVDPLHDTAFRLFDGFYCSMSWHRSGKSAGMQLHFVHFIDDLNTAAMLNGNFYPGSAYNANINAAIPVGSGGSDVAWAPIVPGFHPQIESLLRQDTWLQVLHPWMEFLSKSNRLESESSLVRMKANRSGNDSALAVLPRMKGGGKSNYVPLALKTYGDTGTIAENIGASLLQASLDSWISPSLWGKLIGDWAPSLFLSIVPRVEDVVVVPAVAALRTPYKTIKADEYTDMGRVGDLSQILLGIGILHGSTSSSGADSVAGQLDANPQFVANLAGWFPPTAPSVQAKERGVIMMKQPPGWLSSDVEQSKFAVPTTGANGTVIGGVMAPGAGTAPTAKSPAAGAANTGGFLDEYAHHWFVTEALKSRTSELSGKLRFDIAPGSQVMIEGRGEKFVSADATGVDLHATVIRVSFFANATTGVAGTSFSLAHVRTAVENAQDLFSVTSPPLYEKPWLGAPLVDQFG